ncbi:MAG: DUF3492 domain-containing protein [Tepidimonas ignava]
MNADVMLLLEGTYPYTRGGVAAWVDQLVRAHPQLRFHAVYIGAGGGGGGGGGGG